MFQNKVVGQHLAGMGTQQLQDLELVLGEVDFFPGQSYRVLGYVQDKILDLIYIFLNPLAVAQAVRPAQGSADTGQQLGHAEGLYHIVVGTHVQSLDLL